MRGIVRHRITNSSSKEIVKEIYQREKKDPTKHDITIKPVMDEFYEVAAYVLGECLLIIGKKPIGPIMIISASTNFMIIKYE